MRSVVIVQARLGSTRLPGKVLLPLGGQTVLRHVLERCAAIPGIDAVCCAIPAGPADDPVAHEASRCGAIVTRGSESDVLERYHQAAIYTHAQVVMRVTSDCPLIDPYQAGHVLSLVTQQGADYACNNLPRSWPHGLDCEAVSFAWLDRAAANATLPYDREHVTPYVRNHPDVRKLVLHGPGGAIALERWTLDTEADLLFLRDLFTKLPLALPPTTIESFWEFSMHSGKPLPYGRQNISQDDIAAVVDALQSDWLTTGPAVDAFESAFAAFTASNHAVAVSSGTAALHCAMHALGIGAGDEVIVPAMTFAATSNAVIYCGGTPVFADVFADTLLIDPASMAAKITPKTRAVVIVDYAGQPCDYAEIRALCQARKLSLVADSCHALGATYKGTPIGSLADLTTFSFHPVKHITTGEGGMITTNNSASAANMRTFRNHGITTDHRQRSEKGSFFYEMVELGFNYRLTDFQAALGTSQLRKLPAWIEARKLIASEYHRRFNAIPEIKPLALLPDRSHAYHLYVVRIKGRDRVFAALRQQGIGVNVHYLPVHLHPYYRQRFGYGPGLCPVAEAAYEEILSLPIFPQMDDNDIARVVHALKEAIIP